MGTVLIAGATGFVGHAILRQMDRLNQDMRIMLEPSKSTPALPRGVSVDVSLTSRLDARGVRAAMVGVETIINVSGLKLHRASSEDLWREVEGTRILVDAAAEAEVRCLVYLSRIGAERASAYPMMQASAEAEEWIRQSSVPHVIYRSSVLFGPGDNFTTSLAILISFSPFFVLIPSDESVLLQPLAVEDLATAISWGLDDERLIGQTIELGGPEFMNFRQVIELVAAEMGHTRGIVPLRAPYLRGMAWLVEHSLREPPISTNWLDYLAVSRATDLNSMPSQFGLEPRRMEGNLAYLNGVNWNWALIRRQFPVDRIWEQDR
jgi:NADH dehydrogenase